MATTTRHGHMRDGRYVRTHTAHYKPGAGGGKPSPRVPRPGSSRADLLPDLAVSSLLGVLVYGLAQVFLLTAVAIVTSLVAVLLSLIGQTAYHSTPSGRRRTARRRRRGPVHRRVRAYASRKARLRWARFRRSRAASRKQRREGAVRAQRLEQQVVRERNFGARKKAPVKRAAPAKRAAP